MKLLLDECVPKRLSRALAGHRSLPVPALGWDALRNNRLVLRAGQRGFAAILTVDRRIAEHADRTQWLLGVVILDAESNRYEDLLPLASQIQNARTLLRPGLVLKVSANAIAEVPAE